MQNTIDGHFDEESNGDNAKKCKQKDKDISIKPLREVKNMSSCLLVTMLYVALNIDRSDIQISHLFRFIQEGRLNVNNFERHLPEDVDVKAIPNWKDFLRSCAPRRQIGTVTCRAKAMTLFKVLDLGSPVVPDMRKIISNYIIELCLPDEFKNLVFSLMQLWSCEFLEIDRRCLNNLLKVPNYEVVAMSYIVVGLKICFGLDDDYEYKLADVVDRINAQEMYPKCHKLGFTPEPSGRLFSFREWITFLQFRRKMLTTHRLCTVEDEHYLDTDDYIFMEYWSGTAKSNITLTDELSMNIINKIPLNKDEVVIPKSEFPHTLTPMTTYVEIIAHHCTDMERMQLLCEDFTQYSLKFACESLDLTVTGSSNNVIIGVSDNKKIVKGSEILCGYLDGVKVRKRVEMVYIRNCDNKNWLKTKKPTLNHITFESCDKDKSNNGDIDTESDYGYDSHVENISSDKDTSTDVCESSELETIREEEEDKNIFDDPFENLENRDQTVTQDDHNFDVLQEEMEEVNEENKMVSQNDIEDNNSMSSENSFEFNPETFNRERAINELILHACKKYKIPIPKEYKTAEHRKRKNENLDEGQTKRKYVKSSERVETKQKINKLLEAYYNYVEKDVINQVAKRVQSAIWEVNQSKFFELPIEQSNEIAENHEFSTNTIINNLDESKEVNASSILPEGNSVSKVELEIENMEPTLFENENDNGEVDDLIPKSDAQFDENKYDVNQLYIKMDPMDAEDICASIQDPEIDRILKREIEECDRKEDNLKNVNADEESTDTEDELPLAVIKEERDIYLQETEDESNYKPLIEFESVHEFKYWMKRYNSTYMANVTNVGARFDTEMFENMPRTFNFLLKECATIAGCKQFCLYKSMQSLEQRLLTFIKN